MPGLPTPPKKPPAPSSTAPGQKTAKRLAARPSPRRAARRPTCGLEHAGYAALDLGTFQRHLAQADVVQGLNALAPRINLRAVDLTSGRGVLEEERER